MIERTKKANGTSYGEIIIAIPNIIQNINFDECVSHENTLKTSKTVIAHYTTTEVLDILLSTATFRASNLLYQNDALEYIHGIESMREWLDSKKDELEKSVNLSGRKLSETEQNTLTQLTSIIEKLKKEELSLEHFRNERGIYTISFSTNLDLLSQWITYARESGVSIELDTELLFRDAIFDLGKETFYFVPKIRFKKKNSNNQETVSAETAPLKEQPIDEIAEKQLIQEQVDKIYLERAQDYYRYKTSDVLKKIQYFGNSDVTDSIKDTSCELNIIDKQNMIDLIVKTWKTLNCEDNKELALPFLQLFASYIKNSLFAAEQEVRASFYSIEGNLSWLNSYHFLEKDFEDAIGYYRMAHGILRPYMDVQMCAKGSNRKDKLTPCLPLKSITVGPSGTQQLVFDSVVHRLKYGMNKVYDYTKDLDLLKKQWDTYLDEIRKWLKKERNVVLESEDLRWLKNCLGVQWKGEIWYTNLTDESSDGIDVVASQAPLTARVHKTVLTDDQRKALLKNINQHFYISKDGIIVRKSKQSYIF